MVALRVGARRLFVTCAVLFQAPLAYYQTALRDLREPVAPLQVLARSLIDAQASNGTSQALNGASQATNATIVEHVMALAVLPGVLVRKPIKTWNITRDVTTSIKLSTSRMQYWQKAVQLKELLQLGSLACTLGGPMVLFSRKRYSALVFNGLFMAGMLLCGCFFAANELMPTIQFGVALVASAMELRSAYRAPAVAAPEPSSVGAATPTAAAGTAGGKSAKERRKKKAQ